MAAPPPGYPVTGGSSGAGPSNGFAAPRAGAFDDKPASGVPAPPAHAPPQTYVDPATGQTYAIGPDGQPYWLTAANPQQQQQHQHQQHQQVYPPPQNPYAPQGGGGAGGPYMQHQQPQQAYGAYPGGGGGGGMGGGAGSGAAGAGAGVCAGLLGACLACMCLDAIF
jgi:hypothetical protein